MPALFNLSPIDGIRIVSDERYSGMCSDPECCERQLFRSESAEAAMLATNGIRPPRRRREMPRTVVMVPKSEWNLHKIHTHVDGTTCWKKFLAFPCTRRHSVTESEAELTLWYRDEEFMGDAVEFNGCHYSGRPTIGGNWGYYSDWNSYYADRDYNPIVIAPHSMPCPACERPINGGGGIVDGVTYCRNCVARCRCHGSWHLVSELVTACNDYYCVGSEPHCANCNFALSDTSRRYNTVNGQLLCNQCYWRCENCRNCYVTVPGVRNRCPNSGCDMRGAILGYRHTTAMQWLGKPENEDNGKPYYLGFELEVSANRNGRYPGIPDWAEANLQDEDSLELKRDGSVAGFEIVSQPMTPAYFEAVQWEGFFDVLNRDLPLPEWTSEEPTTHGLHVHIGRVAFEYDAVATAAFCYLIGNNADHLERISRRPAYHYCERIAKPVSESIVARGWRNRTGGKQYHKLSGKGVSVTRGAVNLNNEHTIEIRAGRSTRSADDLRDYVRLVYVAAEYIRALKRSNVSIPPKALSWDAFCKWTAENYPVAFPSISNQN